MSATTKKGEILQSDHISALFDRPLKNPQYFFLFRKRFRKKKEADLSIGEGVSLQTLFQVGGTNHHSSKQFFNPSAPRSF